MRSILLAVSLLLAVPAASYAQFYAPYTSWGVENRMGVERGVIREDTTQQKQRVESSRSLTLETFQDGDTTISGARARDQYRIGTRWVNFNGEGQVTGWSMSNSPRSHGFGDVIEVAEDEENLPLGGDELKLNYDFEGL